MELTLIRNTDPIVTGPTPVQAELSSEDLVYIANTLLDLLDAMRAQETATEGILRDISLGQLPSEPFQTLREAYTQLSTRLDLPLSFDEFLADQQSGLHRSRLETALTATAEAIIMGELPNGLETVIPIHRSEVRRRIFGLLIGHNSPEAGAVEEILDEYGCNKVLQLLRTIDENIRRQRPLENLIESEVVEIIMETRGSIETDYGSNGAETRMNYAKRVCMIRGEGKPYLQIVDSML